MSVRKKIIWGLIILFCIIGIFTYFKHINKRGPRVLSRRSISILDQVISPDKKYKATLFYDNGSATVAENIRVSITKNDDNHIYDSDVFFLLNRAYKFNEGDYVKLKWKSNKSLIVEYSKWDESDERKQSKKFKGISIEYTVKKID